MGRDGVKRGRAVSGLLLIVGVGFASLGQFYFAHRREYVWDGVLFWCVAILSFGLLLRRMGRAERGRPGWRLLSRAYRRPLRTLGVIGGVWLSLLAGWLARRQPAAADFGALLCLWLIGVAWFLLSFVPSSSILHSPFFSLHSPFFNSSFFSVWSRLTRWLRDNWVELAGLAALLLVALAVRSVDLEHIPANMGGDEGTQGVAALELLGAYPLCRS
jgi:hypothetical protein